jgi:hypothetical protein
MNEIELALVNTRKSWLDVATELGYNESYSVETTLKCCCSCGLWLPRMRLDLDGLDICNYCLDAYGP